MRSLAQKHSTPAKEEAAMTQAQGPARTRAGRLNEFFARWITSSALGGRFAHWLRRPSPCRSSDGSRARRFPGHRYGNRCPTAPSS